MFKKRRIKKIQMAMLKESYDYKNFTMLGDNKNIYEYLRFLNEARYCGWISSDYTTIQKEVYRRFSYNSASKLKMDYEENGR